MQLEYKFVSKEFYWNEAHFLMDRYLADVMILWVDIASCKTTPTQGGPIHWALPLIHLVIAHIISEMTHGTAHQLMPTLKIC
jgi:hypothetical protein